MLPSEKSERWARRIGYAVLIGVALYLLIWLTSFVWRVAHRALEQRQLPPERQSPAASTG
jgi:hypothetical protein